jgi:uncharacterized SAM-binding protein YcdF (DUF218 family)
MFRYFRFRNLFIVFAAVALLAVVNREFLLTAVARFLVVADTPVPSSLIVVLGGDFLGSRVRAGAELARRGYAPKVLISGPNYGNERTPLQPEGNLAIEMLVNDGYDRKLFESFLIHGGSTIQEVQELAPELLRRRVARIILVTSDYHSRRACLVFSLHAQGIPCQCIGAPDPVFRSAGWWRDAAQRHIVASEWLRIAGTIVLCPVHWIRSLAADSSPTLPGREA